MPADYFKDVIVGDNPKIVFIGQRQQSLNGLLTRLDQLPPAERELVTRYVGMIQLQRQDFNGRMLTIRRDDLRAIAAAAGIDVDALVRRLDDLQLRRA